ncbi:MAG: hypothetical protein LBG64_03690, partial [Pseudomonadales bacterium]|nr:hypothetical protein [Pseudomonadales bacterium]
MSDRRPNVSEMSNYQVNGNNAFRAETQSAPIQQEINPSTQKSQVLFDSENIQGRTDNIVYVDFQGGQEKSISEVQAISNEQNEQAEARKAILRAKILEFNDKLDVPQPHQVEVANSTENNIVTPSNHTEDICKAFNG